MATTDESNEHRFFQQVAEKENRKLKSQQEKKESALIGFGMFGMIGWSVAVPLLLGTALGIWLDKRYPESFSWTLTCLISGLIMGCIIAWNWINTED
jgi:ATP synthase protein I